MESNENDLEAWPEMNMDLISLDGNVEGGRCSVHSSLLHRVDSLASL